MKWLDLSVYNHRLFLGRRPGDVEPSIGLFAQRFGTAVNTATGAGANVLTRDKQAAVMKLGFQLEAGSQGRWWCNRAVADKEFWKGMKEIFPDAVVADVEPATVFDSGEHAQVTYTKLGEHRGKKRLWLEGLRLGDCGFTPGAKFSVSLDLVERKVTLTLSDDGDRAVSRRMRKRGGADTALPIIDLASDDLTDILGESGRVRATLYRGRIEFDLHPVDQAIQRRETRTRANVARGVLTEGTLCAGGGVSTLAMSDGFREAGLTPVVEWIVDRERAYLQAAADNNPVVGFDTCLYEASLEELDAPAMAGVDVMQVSLPCTGHSLSGKAKRGLAKAEDHPTDALAVFGMIRIIDAVQPSVIVSENVTQARDSATYALILSYLKEQGYVIAERNLDGDNAGTLEKRERWWFVAMSRGLAQNFSIENLPAREAGYAKLGDAMESVAADDSSWADNDYLAAKQVRDKAAGKGFARQFVGPDSTAIGTIGKGYAKRRSTEPFVQRADGKERLLTPVEHARVKGIPEVLVADLSQTLAHEILGQSILFGHASALAERIGLHLKDVCGVIAMKPEVAASERRAMRM